MSPKVRQELLHLLSALCDGELAEAQQLRLEELLDADAECRRYYLEYMDLQAQLLRHPLEHGRGVGQPEGKRDQQMVPPRNKRRVQRAMGYVLVAAGTLAASLLLQVFWRLHSASSEPVPIQNPNRETTVASNAEYVATLTQTANCVWQDANEARRAGSRLVPGELDLRKGIARIRFDSGADLILEGPMGLRIDSGTAVTVLRGKVVFQESELELSAPLTLHTPSSTLVDLGTEYAVYVGPEGEEIHVFDGEVQRRPKTAPEHTAPELLKAGEARRYGLSPEEPALPAQLDPTTFVRQVGDSNQPLPEPATGLLAYEGFDYQDPELFRTGKANGGFGWKGCWIPTLIRPQNKGDHNLLTLNSRGSLRRPGSAAPSLGGSFEHAGFTKFQRRLATPVRLDVDGLYYLSFLFRRESPSTDPINAVAVLLRTAEDPRKEKANAHKRLNLGVGGPNQIFTHLGGAGLRTPVPLNYAETYLFVAKIAAGSTSPDQVFIRVYGPQESVEREEPSSWTVVGPPFHSDLVFDWLELHINSRARLTIDELRLGTTWSSVAGPWVSDSLSLHRSANP